jgi:hypothetical protein
MHVRRALDRKGRDVPPRTRHSVRDVVLMPGLAEALQQHRERSRFNGPEDFVFASRVGTPPHRRNVWRQTFDGVHEGWNRAAALGTTCGTPLRRCPSAEARTSCSPPGNSATARATSLFASTRISSITPSRHGGRAGYCKRCSETSSDSRGKGSDNQIPASATGG